MRKSKKPGIFIRGLRHDIVRSQLKDSIAKLMFELNINVSKSRIDIVYRNNWALGFVHLDNLKAVDYALFHLASHGRRQKINFNFNEISYPEMGLYVAEIRSNESSNSPGRDRSNNGLQEQQRSTVEAGTSISGLAKPSSMQGLNVATSISGLTPQVNSRFYHLNENLGNETRNVEFKEGGGNYRQNVLKEHVGKYSCSFLNSTEGGSLFVGVNNNGFVKGIICNHGEEDNMRLRIDETIKQLSPPVFPNMYSVSFIPVLNNLKVLEVKVNPTDHHTELYSFQDKFFIRRDGSVQCLKSTEIKDWARKQARENLPKIGTHQSQIEGMAAKLQDIEKLLNDHKKRKDKKSHVCVLF